MPAERQRADRKVAVSRGSRGRPKRGKAAPGRAGAGAGEPDSDGLDARLEEKRLAARKSLFSVLVVILAAVALWFVVSTLKGGRREDAVSLAANVRYTVKVGEVPSERREAVERMLDNRVLKSLVGDHELFVHEMAGGRLALCAGRFRSKDSPPAQELLGRLRSYSQGGRRPFGSAGIWPYTPAGTE